VEGRRPVIRCHLARLMGEHKMKIVDVAQKTGLHRNTISLLYKETAARVDFETMDKLCELFNCEIGDIFEFSSITDKDSKLTK
jgi:putative transcriptional regulator